MFYVPCRHFRLLSWLQCQNNVKKVAFFVDFFLYFHSFFLNCYLAVPRPTLGHSPGDSLTNLMLITTYVRIRPEGHREPRNEVESLSPAEHLAGFEPGTFRFLFQRLNPLGHSIYTIPPGKKFQHFFLENKSFIKV